MKVLIIPGSLRPNSAGNKIIPYVEKELLTRDGVEVEVATSQDINLPLYDADFVRGFSDADAPHESVRLWSEKVAAADAFVFMVPEYNAGVTAVQKNYIDWLYKEWNDKKAAIVTYNHYDKKTSANALRAIFNVPKIKCVEPSADLKFGEDIDAEGNVTDESAVVEKVKATVTALVEG